MNTEQEETVVEILPDAIAYNAEKAIVDSQIATAKLYPRNIKRATQNAIDVVTMNKETAETCTYTLPRAGKTISGPSVHLARIIGQLWGNMRVESKIISVDARRVTAEATCHDLETNYAVRSQIALPIVYKDGQRYNDDMIAMVGNGAAARAFRNVVFAVVPKSIVDQIQKSARQMVLGDVSDEQKLSIKRKKVIDGLKGTYEVTEKEILSVVKRAAVEHIDADDLVMLIEIGTAIKDGETTVEEAFRNKGQVKANPLEKTPEEKIEVKTSETAKEPEEKGKKKDGKLF